MKRALVDTGPLVALLDEGDGDHHRCVVAAKRLRSELITTWPVITEAMYLLGEAPAGQEALLGTLEAGDLQIADLSARDAPAIRMLMRTYRDQPMDFADASLVRIAEREGVFEVFTLDRDFTVYRAGRGRSFTVIP